MPDRMIGQEIDLSREKKRDTSLGYDSTMKQFFYDKTGKVAIKQVANCSCQANQRVNC
uniref:Uncharacterized protein n=1 Tax=Arundo donax TaxID=35708 RepID=A0A0A9AZN9_ARUDO